MIKFNYWKFCAWYVVLVPVAGVLWWLAFEPAYGSSLAMPMKVQLDQPVGATPIKVMWIMSHYGPHPAMEYLLAHKEKAAEWVADHKLWAPETFDGTRFDFRVFGDDTGSMLGVTLAYAQHKYLLVLAELIDGRWVGTIADIPDARTTREMRVLLP